MRLMIFQALSGRNLCSVSLERTPAGRRLFVWWGGADRSWSVGAGRHGRGRLRPSLARW